MCVVSLALLDVHPALAAPNPPADWSYYVTVYDTTNAYNLGCDQGTFDKSQSPYANSLVILDFGVQTSSGSGTIATFTNATLTNSQVSNMVYQFARGYFNCTGIDSTSILDLGVGTNDSDNYSTSTYSALGTDWANLMESINSSLAGSGYTAQVQLYGANDIEDWYGAGTYVPASDANAWVNAYAAAANPGYFDYGDADGCSTTTDTNTACANGYDQYDYYYYSWGAAPALAVPEIYYSGSAWQWTRISQYASIYQSAMRFDAPMDEHDIDSSTLTASQAYSDLFSDLTSLGLNNNIEFATEIHCWPGYTC